MPTPIGHTLAALTIASAVRTGGRPSGVQYYALAAVLGCLPDIELAIELMVGNGARLHQGPMHSFGFAAALALVLVAVAHRAGNRAIPFFLFAFGCLASHPLLDSLRSFEGPRAGIPLLWPFSSRPYELPWHIFGHSPGLSMLGDSEALRVVLLNVGVELVVLLPFVAFTFGLRRLQSRRKWGGPNRVTRNLSARSDTPRSAEA